jgi:hypothetical protein
LAQQTRHFWIVFNHLQVNHNHEGAFEGSGEWHLFASANGKQINLAGDTHLNSVWNGNGYWLGDKRMEIEIPQSGIFRLAVGGYEEDKSGNIIPDLTPITKIANEIPQISDYATAAQILANTINLVGNLNGNDNLGVIIKDFSAVNNFGLGPHVDPSIGGEGVSNDYVLSYNIEEFKPMPNNALTVEVFVHANFVGSSAILSQNSPFIGGPFHDSISSIKVHPGPGYQAGDTIQLCENVDYGGNCKPFGPGDYNYVGNDMNDRADSIKFIRP